MGINEHTPIGQQVVWYDREKGELVTGEVTRADVITLVKITVKLADGCSIMRDASEFTPVRLIKED